MPENFANRYQTALAAGVTSGAATGTVTSVTGIPAYPFRAIISSEGANTDEIVLVTLVAGTTLTWTRAAEAVAGVQAASAHGIGATFTAIVTAVGLLNSFGAFDVRAYGATGDGTTDDTAAIQAAINAAHTAGGGIVRISAGTYIVDGLTLKSGVRVSGVDWLDTILKAKAGGSATALFSLDTGPVQAASITDLSLVGNGVAGQRGIWFKAIVDGTNTGGFWHSYLRELHISGFAGDGVWLQGGPVSGTLPHQFLSLDKLWITAADTKYAMLISGQVGQVTATGGLYDGSGIATHTTSVLHLVRELDDSQAIISDEMPYNITFVGVSIQTSQLGVDIDRAHGIRFQSCYWETTGKGMYIAASADLVTLAGCGFYNAANLAGNGYIVGVDGNSRCKIDGCFITGTTDAFVKNLGSGSIEVSRNSQAGVSPVTSNLTTQISEVAGVLTLGSTTTFLVNTSGTNIVTITSEKGPGEMVFLRAWGGTIKFATGGNIDLGSQTSPYTVANNGVAVLVRMDLGVTWQLISVF